jgi:hypothetical protein
VVSNPTALTDPSGAFFYMCDPEQGFCNWGFPGLSGGGAGCVINGALGPCPTLGYNAYAICPGNACSGTLSGPGGIWLPVEYSAIWSGGYYSCSVAGVYDAQNTAGIAAVACTAGEAAALGVEVGGDINRLPNGQFTFAGVVTGTPSYVDITTSANTVAIFNVEVTGWLPEYIGGPDINSSNQFNMPLYRGTPGGRIELYNPATNNQFPGGCVLVGSPLPPLPNWHPAGMPKCN